MAILEPQLETWAKPGASVTSKETYATIKATIDHADAPYSGRRTRSFLQGSYGNDTNVFGVDSDVDIALKCGSVYYYDLKLLTEAEQEAYKKTHKGAEYNYALFKADVSEWLAEQFTADFDPGDKAIRVKGRGSRRDADVLPCINFRRYLKFNGDHDEEFDEGICFFMPNKTQVINYPKQHSENCTAKHQATGGMFKPLVRVLKNMRNRMVSDGTLEAGIAPSYYLEGLMYNVPDELFKARYDNTFVAAINWIGEQDKSTFVCANRQYYLLREGSPVTWRAEKCETFLNATIELWKNW